MQKVKLAILTHRQVAESVREFVGNTLGVLQGDGLQHRKVELQGFEIISAEVLRLAVHHRFAEVAEVLSGIVRHHLTELLLNRSLVAFLLAASLSATLHELSLVVSFRCHSVSYFRAKIVLVGGLAILSVEIPSSLTDRTPI